MKIAFSDNYIIPKDKRIINAWRFSFPTIINKIELTIDKTIGNIDDFDLNIFGKPSYEKSEEDDHEESMGFVLDNKKCFLPLEGFFIAKK